MLPFVFGAFFSIEDVPCLSAWLFLCVFPWGVSAVVLFFFFEAVGLFIYVEKQGFRHLFSTVRSRFSVFLVQVARKFCGHWKIAFSRMIFRCAESESRKCRMEAKNVLFTWFFVNVWLPVAGRIRFLQR